MKTWHLRRGLTIFRWFFFGVAGVGGIVLEVLGHKEAAISVLGQSMASAEWQASVVTVGSLIAAGVLYLVELGLDLRDHVARRRRNNRFGRYRCRPARTPELEVVHQFWKAEFGDEIAPFEQMRQWHGRHPELFWVLHEPNLGEASVTLGDVVGSFSAIPITKKARTAVDRDALAGAGLTLHDVVRPNRVPAALYIGGVIALNRRAKAESLAFLEGHLRWYRKNGVALYARAVRERGLDLLNANVFVPVGTPGLNHVYRLEAAATPVKGSRSGRGSRVLKGEKPAPEKGEAG
jgi:hypothetical protein